MLESMVCENVMPVYGTHLFCGISAAGNMRDKNKLKNLCCVQVHDSFTLLFIQVLRLVIIIISLRAIRSWLDGWFTYCPASESNEGLTFSLANIDYAIDFMRKSCH